MTHFCHTPSIASREEVTPHLLEQAGVVADTLDGGIERG